MYGAPESGDQLLVIEVALLEEQVHQFLVALGDHLHERGARFLGRFLHLLGDVAGLALAVAVELVGVGLHREEVDDTLEVVSGADGQLHGHRLTAERVHAGLDRVGEFRVLAIESVDHDDCRDGVVAPVLPDLLGHHVDAGERIDHDDGAVGHAQGALRLGAEHRVPRACR